jgi:tetratricopeptide (TPR) repeat protein/tRNA A-37 threonylcarbamoyl transferase component Bud32
MTAERWKQVEALFHQAAEMPPAGRDAWLESACRGDEDLKREVRDLLASDDVGRGFLEGEIEDAIVDFHAAGTPKPPKRVGPYKLVSVLGRGGMGAVYLAERADDQYKGEVAIKLVRPGMDTDFFLARFRRERQTLARLQHPHIARLLDSGTTSEGLPYIVMERIRGKPITSYCREHRLGIEPVLRLFLPVCAAVAHAHLNFVVHRDIKPGNILVDENGDPKLLDFGICKLLFSEPSGSETVEAAPMTPDYASPEQVRGDTIGVASDVYSLGAVLFELLTGARPHAIGKYTPREVERAICEEDVRLPSAAVPDRAQARRLAGDLDNILLKALQKEPARRYSSVEHFAADIRAYLAYQPVSARPDSLGYRARKFVQRNRAVLAAVAAMVAILGGGIVVAAHEASVARLHFVEARRLANALIFDVHDRVRDLPGSVPAREAIVRIGLGYLDRLAASSRSDPELRLELAGAYERLGQVQGDMLGSYSGDTAGGLASYRKGLAMLEPWDHRRNSGLRRMSLLHRVGDFLTYTGKPAEALPKYEEAVQIGTALRASAPADFEVRGDLAAIYQALARMQRLREDESGALANQTMALKLMQESLAQHPGSAERQGVAIAHSMLGIIQQNLDRVQEAKANYELSTKQWDELLRAEPNNVNIQRQRMFAYSHLGEVLGSPAHVNLGDYPGALAAFGIMLDTARRLYDAHSQDVAATIDYGMALMRVATVPQPDGARREAMFHESIGLLSRVAERVPANKMNLAFLASDHELLGDLLAGSGKTAAAREEFRAAFEIAGKIGAAPAFAQRIYVTAGGKLGIDAARAGNETLALEYDKQALAAAQKAAAAKNVARAYADMGEVYEILRRRADARAWRERSLAAFRDLEKQPGFNSLQRAEMQRVEAALKRTP